MYLHSRQDPPLASSVAQGVADMFPANRLLIVEGWRMQWPSIVHMGVSINGGTPKWLVYTGQSYQNGWWLGVPPWPWKPPYVHDCSRMWRFQSSVPRIERSQHSGFMGSGQRSRMVTSRLLCLVQQPYLRWTWAMLSDHLLGCWGNLWKKKNKKQ